jgi:hypothetical protein
MKLAVVIYGHYFRKEYIPDDESAIPEQKLACESQLAFIDNLRKSGIEVDIYINTYTTPYKSLIEEWYGDAMYFYSELNTFKGPSGLESQKKKINEGIALIKDIDSYDAVYCVRADTCFEEEFTFVFDINWNKIMFNFVCWRKEYKLSNNDPRIGDTMMFIPKKYFYIF